MYRLHLLRHGLTQANLEGRYVGSTDLPLCPEGFAQLQHLLREGEYPFAERVYAAPLMRCRQTASMLYPDNTIRVVERLTECSLGEFEGKTMEELRTLWPQEYRSWMEGGPQAAPPGGENSAAFLDRLIQGVQEILTDLSESDLHTASVIVPGGAILMLLTALGYPKREYVQWQMDPGMGYTILVTPSLWMRDRIFEVCDVQPHLYADTEGSVPFGAESEVSLVELPCKEPEEEK